MTRSQSALDRLQHLVEADLPDLAKNAIVPLSDTVYQVFDRYVLNIQKSRRAQLMRYGNLVSEFTSARLALAWCIADKYNQQRLREQILQLDQQKSMLINDLAVRTALAERMRDRTFVEAKIDTRRHLLQQLDFRLDKCVNLAKYWQTQGFNNETVRTGRTPSKRTSR
jgi:hypothetical protein